MLTSGLYAIPALVGAFIVVAADRIGAAGLPAALVAAAVCFAIRMLGVRYDVQAPGPRETGPGGMMKTCEAMSVEAALRGLDAIRSWQEDFYRDLHAHPELPHQEHRTAGNVAARLRDTGFEVHEGIGGTGVVGILRNGDGPTVLLRADMDALPVLEATGLSYASTQTADDGTPVMHACGHDVHVTCLLGAAALMSQAQEQWAGTLVALFQPAEETADGARAMVEDGLGRARGSCRCRDGPTCPAVPCRHCRHPSRTDTVGCRQYADHRSRSRSPRVDAAGGGGPGRPGGDDRGPSADRRGP